MLLRTATYLALLSSVGIAQSAQRALFCLLGFRFLWRAVLALFSESLCSWSLLAVFSLYRS